MEASVYNINQPNWEERYNESQENKKNSEHEHIFSFSAFCDYLVGVDLDHDKNVANDHDDDRTDEKYVVHEILWSSVMFISFYSTALCVRLQFDSSPRAKDYWKHATEGNQPTETYNDLVYASGKNGVNLLLEEEETSSVDGDTHETENGGAKNDVEVDREDGA